MQSRLFHGQQQDKIKPTGLQYILRKHDLDISLKRLVFNGVELLFDSQENLRRFIDQFNKLDDPQLMASFSYHKKIGHLINQNKSFCIITTMINSDAYWLSHKNHSLAIEGEIIFKELDKKVHLAGVEILDFNFYNGTFIKDVGVKDEDYSDAPGYLNCPISQDLMKDPITLSSGITYDRCSLSNLFSHHNYPDELPCPMTKLTIRAEQLNFKTNVLINGLIAEYKEKKKAMKINDRKDECSDKMEVESITQLKI